MDIIDGKAISEQILEELRSDLVGSNNGRPPCVAFIRVGEDPASVSYVNKKQKVSAILPKEGVNKEGFKTINAIGTVSESVKK